MMNFTGDVFFRNAPDPTALRTVAARAYGVVPGLVMLRDMEADTPYPGDVELVFLRLSPNVPGDYPVRYDIMLDDDRMDDLPTLLSTLAHDFGTLVLSSADDDNDLLMNLYLPDGSEHDVLVDQDDDGGIRNTPEMRRLIDPVAVAS